MEHPEVINLMDALAASLKTVAKKGRKAGKEKAA